VTGPCGRGDKKKRSHGGIKVVENGYELRKCSENNIFR
jgi:hypothetical protein